MSWLSNSSINWLSVLQKSVSPLLLSGPFFPLKSGVQTSRLFKYIVVCDSSDLKLLRGRVEKVKE